MSKITFQAGEDTEPLFKVTIETIYERHGVMYELQELIAKYMVRHGGLQWSVKKE